MCAASKSVSRHDPQLGCHHVERLPRALQAQRPGVAEGRWDSSDCWYVPLMNASSLQPHAHGSSISHSVHTHFLRFREMTRISGLHPITLPNFKACPPLPSSKSRYYHTGTKRISITLRERKETLPPYLLPIPDCRCGVAAVLKARVLPSGEIEYLYQCDRGQGQCGFLLSKALASDSKA